MKFWDIDEETLRKGKFDFDIEREKLISNLDYLYSMSVQEQTLYKKWMEFNGDLYSSMVRLPVYQSYYDMIWKPTDIQNKDLTISEINNLQPYVEIVEDGTKWSDIRRLISSMEFTSNPGRNLKAYVKDRVTGKLLGVISLASDVTSIAVRDKYIGWNNEDKFKKGKLNNTAIGTSIIPTQPLGFNFLGGKLIAALTTSPTFRSEWEQRYDDILIAVGTTSLYGDGSMYNSIPHYKSLGESNGKINIKPDDSVYHPWHQWLKRERKDWYDIYIMRERDRNGQSMGYDLGPVSSMKQKTLNKIFRECGIKANQYHHGYKRGVYFAQMYENGNDFLCSKIDEDKLVMKKKFIEGDDFTIRWWKERAINRYSKLHEEGRLKPEILYYIDIIGMTWEQCKEKYLKEIGR